MNIISNEILISVIVPVFNSENHISRCIESILAQSFANFELILINDGSTDSSFDICKKYHKKDGRIRLFSQENKGVGAARNYGLDVAVGKYIVFVDSDDYIDNTYIETLFESIMDGNYLVVMSGIKAQDELARTIWECSDCKRNISNNDAFKEHYFNNKKTIYEYVFGKMFNRVIFENIRFETNLYWEDLEILPYWLTISKIILNIPYLGYYYVQHPDSIVHQNKNKSKKFCDTMFILKKHIDYYLNNGMLEISNKLKVDLIEKIITKLTKEEMPIELKKKAFEYYDIYLIDILRLKIPFFNKVKYISFRLIGPKLYRRMKNINKVL